MSFWDDKKESEPGNFEWIPGYFQNEDIFIVASGPSLDGFDFNKLRNLNTIVFNRTLRDCPNGSIAVDVGPDNKHRCKYDPAKLPMPVIASTHSLTVVSKNVAVVKRAERPSIHPHKGFFWERTSAAFALNAALSMTIGTVYLLGVDCYFHGRRHHYFQGKHWDEKIESQYTRMIPEFDRFRRWSDRIINLSPRSRVSAFKKEDWRKYF